LGQFQALLESLVREACAGTAVLFRRDPLTQVISVVTQVGTRTFPTEQTHVLLESPVRDVIEEMQPVWENQVIERRGPRFAKLLAIMPFESCIGIPIEAAGRTDHALFLFDRSAEAFPAPCLREARVTANLLAAVLERQALEERSVAAASVFLSGQLAAGFGHEVHNKLQGLDLQFRNLQADMRRVAQIQARNTVPLEFAAMQQALERAVTTADELKQAVLQFRRLMEPRPAGKVDVNHQLRQAEMQVRPLARRAKVELRLVLAPSLLPVLGSDVGLYQVFVNLMLNAIQQMDLKPDPRRFLTVTSALEQGDSEQRVCIRFADTGPGIHRKLCDKIFDLGFTTRPGGSGLGLFISRRLIEHMGGSISVEESLVTIGTTFLIKLPVTARRQGDQPRRS
jgi:signal transduction histidine kinase